MADQYPGRPDHPDFWVLSRIIIDQDTRAASHASSLQEMIAEVADVPSLVYMASQRALRAKTMLTGPTNSRLMSLWLDAFMAGVAYGRRREN